MLSRFPCERLKELVADVMGSVYDTVVELDDIHFDIDIAYGQGQILRDRLTAMTIK